MRLHLFGIPVVRLAFVLLAGGAALHPLGLRAQEVLRSPLLVGVEALPLVTGPYEDRLRTSQLWGAPADGFLLRSTSTLLRNGQRGNDRQPPILTVHPPTVLTTYNSDIPDSPNQGHVWGGRGWSTGVVAGVTIRQGPLTLTLAPEWSYSENREFELRENWLFNGRYKFSPAWQTDTLSIDVPLRFGEDPLHRGGPGQSSITLAGGGVAVGYGTENHWWGPGIRNAIVLSNNAPGFPHAFLRTDGPADLGFGKLDAVWIGGELRESGYFSDWFEPESRSLSGAALTFSPALEPSLTLGVARTVYSTLAEDASLFGRSAAVFVDWSGADELERDEREDPSEQIISLFGRWLLPSDRAEIYAEWARYRLPLSVRDFLSQPNHSQGYTLGMQWGRPILRESLVRAQAEFTYLERSSTFRLRPIGSYYTSLNVPQGYTHRGRVLGAAIGPGASSQWIALDLQRRESSVGVFGGRVRWNNDGYHRFPSPLLITGHDVGLQGGVRGHLRLGAISIAGEYAATQRLNYLFQNPAREYVFAGEEGVDILNHTMRWTISVAERTPR